MEYTGYELLWMFLVYSFAGWCGEVSLAAVKRRRLIMKGFLNAPFCPLYGFSAVAFGIFLPELKNNIGFLFLGGMVIASFLEYLSGYFLERIFHRKWWDYSDRKYHVNGYICLSFSLVWGILAVLMMKYINPLLLWLVYLIPRMAGRIIVFGILAILLLDAVSVSSALGQMHSKLGGMGQISEDLQKLSDSLGNALTRRIQRRLMKAYPNISVEELVKSLTEKSQEDAAREQAGVQIFASGCGFYKIVSLFLIGALLGDIVETIFCYMTTGVLMSRSSVVYGPFSIVWGLGCALFTAILYQYRDKSDRVIFLFGTVLGGVYEYICSVFTELVFGTVFWDYSGLPFNLGGRINLLYCFFWGIAAVIWLKMIFPRLSDWIEKIPKRGGTIGCNVLIVFMIVNMAMSGLALVRYTERHVEKNVSQNAVGVFLDEHFPDERIERVYPNAKIVS